MKSRTWGRKMAPRKPDARRQLMMNTTLYTGSIAAFMMTVAALTTLR